MTPPAPDTVQIPDHVLEQIPPLIALVKATTQEIRALCDKTTEERPQETRFRRFVRWGRSAWPTKR